MLCLGLLLPTALTNPAQVATSPLSVLAHQCGNPFMPLHGMWWDVGPHTIWDPKVRCPRDLACPCLVRAESCQP